MSQPQPYIVFTLRDARDDSIISENLDLADTAREYVKWQITHCHPQHLPEEVLKYGSPGKTVGELLAAGGGRYRCLPDDFARLFIMLRKCQYLETRIKIQPMYGFPMQTSIKSIQTVDLFSPDC
jgi:hypothetical protein